MMRLAFLEKKEFVRGAGEGLRFAGTMLAAALVLYFIFSPFENALQNAEAGNVRAMLGAVGVATRDSTIPNQFWVSEKLIEISPLCSGLVEMALLAGAIMATRHVSRKKRIMGVVAGVFALYIFNLFRITITVLQLRYASLAFAALTHDVLFRVVLILGFAGIYAVWVRWASKRGW